jgi:hypothetical protein
MEVPVMSTQKLIRSSMAVALTLTLAGAASARRPPALAEAQTRTNAVFSTCPESQARDTSGYRDMLARSATPVVTPAAFAITPVPRKMGNHLVLACEGGEIHQGSGYRDFPVRVMPESTEPQIARGPSPTTLR